MIKYSISQRRQAVQYHLANNSNSLEQSALTLGIGRATLTRWLADEGHHKLPSHKSTEDRKMLRYLESKGIYDLSTLTKFV